MRSPPGLDSSGGPGLAWPYRASPRGSTSVLGLFLMVVVLTLFAGRESEPVVRLLVANAYAVGFIFVILGRSELFTEHATLAVLPVLEGKASVSALGRMWGLTPLVEQALSRVRSIEERCSSCQMGSPG